MPLLRAFFVLSFAVVCGCGGADRSLPAPEAEVDQAGLEKPAVRAKNEASLDVVTNSVGMKLVRIPAGEFTMGAVGDELAKEKATPAHKVKLTKPYYLGRTEVTKGEFAKFVAATNYVTEAEKPNGGGYGVAKPFDKAPEFSWRACGLDTTDYHPVVNVTWNDATAFCEWLSKTEGKKYSLPTEAEWEYACRAGTTTVFWNGDDKNAAASIGNVCDALFKKSGIPYSSMSDASTLSDGYKNLAPVARFAPNKFGLYDMHGNVAEYCRDAWYTYEPEAATDPFDPEESRRRVYRGGSWLSDVGMSSSAYRDHTGTDDRGCDRGFRVKLEAAGK